MKRFVSFFAVSGALLLTAVSLTALTVATPGIA